MQAYQEALKEWTRERVPLDWAMTQYNLGTAQQTLGERESDTERLEQAVQAYVNALEIVTEKSVPAYWQVIQRNFQEAQSLIEKRKKAASN